MSEPHTSPEPPHMHEWFPTAVHHYFTTFLDLTRTQVLNVCWCGETKVKKLKGSWTLQELTAANRSAR